MHIEFSPHYDAVAWSDEPAAAGRIRTGPLGLASILETRLGLGGPEITESARVAAYRGFVSEAGVDDGLFAESLAADEWATTRRLLELRDELVEGLVAGDDPDRRPAEAVPIPPGASPRVACMLALLNAEVRSSEAPAVLPGLPDRLRVLAEALAAAAAKTTALELPLIDSIHLHASLDELSPSQRRILDLLEATGTAVDGPGPPADRDPGPEVTLVRTADDWEAARLVAGLLSVGGAPPGDPPGTCLICPGDSSILDTRLSALGLPRIGRSLRSPARGCQQLLHLAVATLWRPPRLEDLLDILSHPGSPISSFAAGRLLRALQDEAGTGGPAWQEAVRDLHGEENRFLHEERFDAAGGAPVAAVLERIAWAASGLRAALATSAPARATMGATERLIAIIEERYSPRGSLNRGELDGLVRMVLAGGVERGRPGEEAAPWDLCSAPGQIARGYDTVVWWDFVSAGAPAASFWTDRERETLAGCGIILESPVDTQRREELAWRRAFSHAGRHLLLVSPRNRAAEALRPHPFLDVLTQERPIAQVDGASVSEIAGRTVPMTQPAAAADEPPDSLVRVREATIPHPASLSYTSLSSLFGCPMRYALQYHVKLRGSRAGEAATEATAVGKLFHRMVEGYFANPAADGIGDWADACFDSLVGREAVMLLAPEAEIDRARTREACRRGLEFLATRLARLGLRPAGTEVHLEAPIDPSIQGTDTPVALRGFADLVCEDQAGRAFVVDVKWTLSSSYRREEVQKREALQLAVYEHLLERTRERSVAGSAYYLPKQTLFLSTADIFGSEALIPERDTDELWRAADAGIRHDLDRVCHRGEVEVTGVAERSSPEGSVTRREKREEAGLLYVEPPCRFCDFSLVCGLGRGTI